MDCQECGEYYEDEDDANGCCSSEEWKMGQRKVAPWVSRGFDVKDNENSDNIVQALNHWGLVDLFSPSTEAASYYLMEVVTNDIYQACGERRRYINPETVYGFKKLFDMSNETIMAWSKQLNLDEFGKIMLEASILMVDKIIAIEPVLMSYCQMAIGGELRHHIAVGGSIIDPPSRRAAAWKAWKTIVEAVGPDIFTDAAELFREFSGGAYGGEKWALPCEIVKMRLDGELGPTEFQNLKLFVDRVWTLEHNGGCFLNKIEWKNNGLNNMKAVLNAHAGNPENLTFLYNAASDEVQKLFARYMKIAQETSKANMPEFDLEFDTQTFELCSSCHGTKDMGHFSVCLVAKNPSPKFKYLKLTGVELKQTWGLLNKVMLPPASYFYTPEGKIKDDSVHVKCDVNVHQYFNDGDMESYIFKYEGKLSGLFKKLNAKSVPFKESNFDLGFEFVFKDMPAGAQTSFTYKSGYDIKVNNLNELVSLPEMRVI